MEKRRGTTPFNLPEIGLVDGVRRHHAKNAAGGEGGHRGRDCLMDRGLTAFGQ
jgi:hypothetical protein